MSSVLGPYRQISSVNQPKPVHYRFKAEYQIYLSHHLEKYGKRNLPLQFFFYFSCFSFGAFVLERSKVGFLVKTQKSISNINI